LVKKNIYMSKIVSAQLIHFYLIVIKIIAIMTTRLLSTFEWLNIYHEHKQRVKVTGHICDQLRKYLTN